MLIFHSNSNSQGRILIIGPFFNFHVISPYKCLFQVTFFLLSLVYDWFPSIFIQLYKA